jgi:hypothetical protein
MRFKQLYYSTVLAIASVGVFYTPQTVYGSASDCTQLETCGQGIISQGLIICKDSCTNLTCPTIVDCGSPIISGGTVICEGGFPNN